MKILKISFIVFAMLILASCASTKNDLLSKDILKVYVDQEVAWNNDAPLKILHGKIYNGVAAMPIDFALIEAKPSQEEKQAIIKYIELEMGTEDKIIGLLKRKTSHQAVFLATKANFLSLASALYRGDITYGAFNVGTQEMWLKHNANIRAVETQKAANDQAAYANFLQNQKNFQATQPKMVNCTTIGNNTTCY